jgi:hypothetical protein
MVEAVTLAGTKEIRLCGVLLSSSIVLATTTMTLALAPTSILTQQWSILPKGAMLLLSSTATARQ